MASDSLFDEMYDSDNSIDISRICQPTGSTQCLSSSSSLVFAGGAKIVSMASQPIIPALQNTLAHSSSEIGEVSPEGWTFTPFKLVREYPYIYVTDSSQTQVMDYFQTTLLRGHVWDLYSQSYPTDEEDDLLLVPTIQFEQYLSVANRHLYRTLAIPSGKAGQIFSLTFGEWNTPRPRFLGQVSDADSFDTVKARTRTLGGENLDHLTSACLQTYQEKMVEIHFAIKSARKQAKAKAAKRKRIQRQKDNGRVLKRAQRYLGLRRCVMDTSSSTTNWDISIPAPFKAKESVRLVSIDAEAYERNNKIVTEIGVAILDTEDIVSVCPGEGGKNWFPFIEAHHIRIKERRYLVNYQYLLGCPEAFNFGVSQMVSSEEVGRVVGRIIGDNNSEDQRPIIIVGHDLKQDLNYLNMVGYNTWGVKQIVDEIDTQRMFQRSERNSNSRSLGMVCAELGIQGYNYHNAGNDAVYTLQAMISMAVKRTVEGSDRDENSFTPGTDEWSDGEMDDGGCPKRFAPPMEKQSTSQPQDRQRVVQW